LLASGRPAVAPRWFRKGFPRACRSQQFRFIPPGHSLGLMLSPRSANTDCETHAVPYPRFIGERQSKSTVAYSEPGFFNGDPGHLSEIALDLIPLVFSRVGHSPSFLLHLTCLKEADQLS
jgi:hypothetical protein